MSERDRLRATFDEVAELYERARPLYPAELFGDLQRLAPAERVLEIGCGTGQATRELVRRGHDVVCIELGANLAAAARATVPQAEVVVSSFEEWDPAGATFDLVLAATSWHWLDPPAAYAKAAALAPCLAIVETAHVGPEDADPFFEQIQDAYVAVGEERSSLPHPDDVADHREGIEASGHFTDVDVHRYLAAHEYTAEEYVQVLETYSGHRAMEPAAREGLYSEVRRLLGDRRVRKHYLFLLHVARRA